MQLSDGKFHSGEDLARELQVSRSAVWKAVGALKVLGATLEAVRNRGYRLPTAASRWTHEDPQAPGRGVRARVRALETTWSIDRPTRRCSSAPSPAGDE